MKVIGHQNIRVEPEGISFLCFRKKILELVVVTAVLKDRLSLVASADDMVNRSGEMDARPSAHEYLLASERRKANNKSLTRLTPPRPTRLTYARLT